MGQCHPRKFASAPVDATPASPLNTAPPEYEDDHCIDSPATNSNDPAVEDPITPPNPPAQLTPDVQNILLNPWILADYHGQIVQVSSSAHILFECADMAGMHIEQLMSPEHAANHHKYITRYLTTRQPHIINTLGRVVNIQTLTGTAKTVLLQISHVPNGFLGMFVPIYDIPDVVKQVAHLEELEVYSRKLKYILDYINHDIRAHLMNVEFTTFKGTLRNLPATVHKWTAPITTMLELANDLSALYVNKYTFRLVSVNYIELFEQMVQMLDTSVAGYAVCATFSNKLRHYDVNVDPGKLTLALQNILHFIRAHSDCAIECETTTSADGGDDIDVIIICTQIWASKFNISAPVCQRLLEGFAPPESGAEQYAGIRLPIAKQIIMQGHDGDITCHQDKFGLTFSVTFKTRLAPRSTSLTPSHAQFEHTAAPDRWSSSSDGGYDSSNEQYNLLIVDDSALTCKLVSRAVRRLAYNASHVPSGAAAIEWLESHSCDLILLDRSMPVLNGIETARIIRKRWPVIKIVGFTGDTSHAYIEEFLQAGAVRVLSKPIDITILSAALKDVLDNPNVSS